MIRKAPIQNPYQPCEPLDDEDHCLIAAMKAFFPLLRMNYEKHSYLFFWMNVTYDYYCSQGKTKTLPYFLI
jgi:hypothetical protein